MSTPELLAQIKRRVADVDPTAQVILFGSYARGEQGPDSDIDLLILLEGERVTYDARRRITYPLFGLELDSGIMISPIVVPRQDWMTRHSITPLFEEVERDGRQL